MGKRIPSCCRLVLPFVLTVLLLFILAPDVRAAQAQGVKLVGPKKYYLVLGNSSLSASSLTLTSRMATATTFSRI